jgi:hypothetical protein
MNRFNGVAAFLSAAAPSQGGGRSCPFRRRRLVEDSEANYQRSPQLLAKGM